MKHAHKCILAKTGVGLALLLTASMAAIRPAAADIIDFSTGYTTGGNPLTINTVTFTDNAGGGYLGPGIDWGGYFANIPGSSQGNALADLDFGVPTFTTVDFNGTANNVSILLSTTPVTTWTLTAYDTGNGVLGFTTVTMPGTSQAVEAFLPYTGIDHFTIVESSANANLTLFDDLRFNNLQNNGVPEPAPIATMGLGVLALAALTIRARRKTSRSSAL